MQYIVSAFYYIEWRIVSSEVFFLDIKPKQEYYKNIISKGGYINMRKNLQKAVGSHFGKPIWLVSMIKPPKMTETTL